MAPNSVRHDRNGSAGPPVVTRVATTRLPTRHGVFDLLGYAGGSYAEQVVLTRGLDAASGDAPSPGDVQLPGDAPSPGNVQSPGEAPAPLVRIHSECLTGDALGSVRCDCGEQLDAALAAIAAAGRGVLVYARGHEGRGIGLMHKLQAYALQDEGLDTVDANRMLGLPVDARDYAVAAAILLDLGLSRIRLLSANPAKQEALERHGIEVSERVPLRIAERAERADYLRTKRARMRHDPASGDAWEMLARGILPKAEPPDELTERYGPLVAAGARLVIAQLGQSLDGFIASRTGDARHVTSDADREHLHRLRALVDAVVVGAGTVVADDCRLTVRAVPGRNPVRVVLDPHARVPPGSLVLTDEAAPTWWVVGTGAHVPERLAPHVEVHRLTGDAAFAPEELLRVLAERGLGRVLVEGGGRTVSRFLRAGVLDRLYLTTAPILIGDGVPGIRFDGSDALAGAVRAPVRRFVLGEDVCTELDLSAEPADSPEAGSTVAAISPAGPALPSLVT